MEMSGKNIKLFCLIILNCFLLAGCKQVKDYDYFMEHPNNAADVYEKCWMQGRQQVTVSTECREVVRAAKDIQVLLTQAESNAMGFGFMILESQNKLAKAEEKVRLAEQNLVHGKTNKEKLQSDLERAKQIVKEERAKINRYYAILKYMGI